MSRWVKNPSAARSPSQATFVHSDRQIATLPATERRELWSSPRSCPLGPDCQSSPREYVACGVTHRVLAKLGTRLLGGLTVVKIDTVRERAIKRRDAGTATVSLLQPVSQG